MNQLSGVRALVVAASLVVLVAGLKIGAPLLVPAALSIFLAITLMPAVSWMSRRGVPTLAAILLVVLTTFAALGGIISIATQSINQMRLAFPRYQGQFVALQASLRSMLLQRGIDLPLNFDASWISPARVMDLASGALVGLAGFMSSVALVLLITVFILIEANGFPAKIRTALGLPELDLSRFTKIADEVQRYLAMKTVISLATGALVGIWVWFLGLDFPLFWGLLAFLLNYVPNVGSILAAVPAVLLALVQLGPKGAALAGAGYLVINMVLGNVIEPNVMGRQLGLSPLVVMFSLVFWGWIWGAIGMLLSVPLTMIIRIMLEHSEEHRWIAVLLGPTPMGTRVPSIPASTPSPEGAEPAAVAETPELENRK
jgi:predicted PurR-regulated permease PerM